MKHRPLALLAAGLIAAFLLTTLPKSAAAQSELAKAKKAYKECYKLLEQKNPCDAYKACKAGLKSRELQSLVDLTAKTKEACKVYKESKIKKCPDGMDRFKGTKGQCCWPGQVWAKPAGGDTSACVGTPTECPPGHRHDRVLATCRKTCDEEGRILTDSDHCCWTGQAWSPVDGMCIGLPTCPEFYNMELVEKTGKDGLEHVVEECRRADTDRDTIPDAIDRCITLSEDFDNFKDDDGCPEPDNDNDGVCDPSWQPDDRDRLIASNCQGVDACPLTSEDFDGFEDLDGCPDVDHDGDNICDPPSMALLAEDWQDQPGVVFTLTCTSLDMCIDEPESFNGFEDTDGCFDLSPEQAAALQAVEDERDTLESFVTAGWVSFGFGVAFLATGIATNILADSRRNDVLDPDRIEGIIITSVKQSDIPTVQDAANLIDALSLSAFVIGGTLTLTGIALVLYGSLTEVEDIDPHGLSISVSDDLLFFSFDTRF